MDLVLKTIALIEEIKPKYWIIENVRGAGKYFEPLLGRWKVHCASTFLWGNIPPNVEWPKGLKSGKEKLSSKQRAERSKIPYEISFAVAQATEAATFFSRLPLLTKIRIKYAK
jgi:hypothetical protein